MACATGCNVDVILRAPYARTLWTYLHLVQQERADELRTRSNAIYAASLMSFAFNEPKRLGEEHRKLMVDAGMVASVDTSRADALALIADVARLDQAGAWKSGGSVS